MNLSLDILGPLPSPLNPPEIGILSAFAASRKTPFLLSLPLCSLALGLRSLDDGGSLILRAPSAPHLTPMFPNTWEQDGHSSPSAPLSKPFGIKLLRRLAHRAQSRPCLTPLFSTLSSKPYTNPPLSNFIRFNHFQTSCKAPLSKSFRMIALQKLALFFLYIPIDFIGKALFFNAKSDCLSSIETSDSSLALPTRPLRLPAVTGLCGESPLLPSRTPNTQPPPSSISPRATIRAMRAPAPAPSTVSALLLAVALGLFSSGCSTSAKESLSRAKQAPPPIEFLGAWGAKGTGPGMLADPRTIAADAFGEVYIVDAASTSRFIQKFTRDGHPLFSFEPSAPIQNPCASAVDLGGSIYVLECGPNSLLVFLRDGKFTHGIRGGLGSPARPSSVTVDNEGRIYVAESHGKRILRYTPRGSLLGAWGGKGTGPGATLHADQIAASLEGALFVCDSDRGWIARISSSGIVQKEWTLPSSADGSGFGAAGHCSLAVTRTSVIALTGPSSAPVLHVFGYDGQEKLSKPLQDLDPSLASVTCAGIAAMADGEFFILDSAAPRVLHLRLNL